MNINVENMLPCLLASWFFVLDDIKAVLQFAKSKYIIYTKDLFCRSILQTVSATE